MTLWRALHLPELEGRDGHLVFMFGSSNLCNVYSVCILGLRPRVPPPPPPDLADPQGLPRTRFIDGTS